MRIISIPTLKEVLELVKASKMEVNIELKTGIYWYLGLEEKVLEIVKNCEMQQAGNLFFVQPL